MRTKVLNGYNLLANVIDGNRSGYLVIETHDHTKTTGDIGKREKTNSSVIW